jgi:hypothetical protein
MNPSRQVEDEFWTLRQLLTSPQLNIDDLKKHVERMEQRVVSTMKRLEQVAQ